MTAKNLLATGIALLSLGLTAQATTYTGNGSTSFGNGGATGNGSLTLTDNGTTISGSLTTAGSLGGNVFVLYISTAAGGFSSTSGFNDNGDQLRSALSQYGGVGQQSTLNFASGFTAGYGIALQPGSGINFGGLWQLANGGANSQQFVSSVNLTPTGSDAAGTYTFSFNLSQIGLTPNSGQSFGLYGIEVSQNGYSSAEILGGTATGANGWGNVQSQATFSTYITTAPEPTSIALCTFGAASLLALMRRRK